MGIACRYRFRALMRISFALGFLGSLMHGLGCSDDDSPTRHESPPAIPDRSSPEAVLTSLREAYLNRQANDYDSLLAADFEFHFCEEDYQIAQKLTRSEEMQVHRNMFGSTEVQNLALSFTLGEPAPDASRPDTLGVNAHLWTVRMVNTDLELRRTSEGGYMTYRVEDAVERFWFRREQRVTSGTGQPIWTIVEWREISVDDLIKGGTRGGAKVQDSSWGRIKALFAGGDCP